MHYFTYIQKILHCEEVDLAAACEQYKTPLYVYSWRTIVKHYKHIIDSWQPHPVVVAYAMKANSNLSILRLFKKLGSWVDTVSGGEIYRALKAGFDPAAIIFGGVGKSDEELEYAIQNGVFLIVADSREELTVISHIAQQLKRTVNVAIRVNPDVDPQTHPYIATGLKESKFGIPSRDVIDCFEYAHKLPGLCVVGIHQHIGSQITRLQPFLEALIWLKEIIIELKSRGIPLEWMDIGGGIGIIYKDEQPFTLEDYAQQVLPIVQSTGCRLILEPGRVIVGNAGILLTKVLFVKDTGYKRFVVVDAAMNDLMRPAFYKAYHEIIPVRQQEGTFVADVVGPVCESGDFLAKNREMAPVQRGDLCAVMSAGAYGFSMASNYNSRPRAAELLVRDDRCVLIRKREILEDLLHGEELPDLLL